MQRLRDWNMSPMVISAILDSEERKEFDSLTICLTRECSVAPCCKIRS